MSEEQNQSPSADQPAGYQTEPSVTRKAFSCPHCGAYTHQYWYSLYIVRLDKDNLPFVPTDAFLAKVLGLDDISKEAAEHWKKTVEKFRSGKVFFEEIDTCYSRVEARNLHLSRCYTCSDVSVWVHDRLLFPPKRSGPEPNEDLPDAVKSDYQEARSVLELSPRGAAALLRLCVEKLCIHLEADGSTLDRKIGDLVEKGLNEIVQKSLDAVRVIGNEAVHPGQMDLEDDRETAEALFKLVNVIAERMISEGKHVDEAYASLSPSKREAIERRDKKSD